MARLLNRQLQIPGGIRFFEPSTQFKIQGQSFNSTVDAVVRMRKANPALAAAKGWATDFEGVANDVDSFNAAICERMGWTTYITNPTSGTPTSPKFKALSPLDQKQLSAVAGKVKKVWQGVRSINDWLEAGTPAVPTEQSEKRAATCVACPLNGKGGLEEWFTKPAAAAIKLQFDKLSERKLSTTLDEKLNVCVSCLCPMRLKVHTPLAHIVAHMGEETRRALDPGCWITAEEKLGEANKTSTAVDSGTQSVGNQ